MPERWLWHPLAHSHVQYTHKHPRAHSHGQADGSVLVAAVGLVARVNRRRLDASLDSTDFDEEEEEEEEEEEGDRPTTFVEVFVLKQKAGMGGILLASTTGRQSKRQAGSMRGTQTVIQVYRCAGRHPDTLMGYS